jgi:periplasmic copper chaperone A
MSQLRQCHSAFFARPVARLASAVILAVAVTCAGLAISAPAQAAKGGLTIHEPWIRMVLPSQPAAGYFTLSNESDKAESLVRASSPACKTLMLHKSVSENGQEKMIMVMSIDVPAHGQVAFAPGGFHLMCMSPTKAVVPGHTIRVTLRFKDGKALSAGFPVRNAKGAAPMAPMKGM